MKLAKTRDVRLPTGVLGLAVDGRGLVAACMDGGIYSVDPTSEKVTPFPGKHTSYASGCVVTRGGLVSAGYDGALIWHDRTTYEPFRRVLAHSFWSWQLAASPNGRLVASVTGQYLAGGERYEPAPSTEPTVRVFDAATGDTVRDFHHGPPVMSVAFSPDGRHVAAGNMMGEIAVWDIVTGERKALVTTPAFTSWGIIKSPHYCGGVFGLAFAPGGALLACGMGPMTDPMAGNGKQTWQRWDWTASPPVKTAEIEDTKRGTGLQEALAFAPDGRTFVMAGRQAQGTWNVALFAADDGRLLASLDTKSRVTRAAFAPDGKTLYLAAAVGQGRRVGGKWPEYGRVHVVDVQAGA